MTFTVNCHWPIKRVSLVISQAFKGLVSYCSIYLASVSQNLSLVQNSRFQFFLYQKHDTYYVFLMEWKYQITCHKAFKKSYHT